MPDRADKGEKKAWAKPELIVLVRGRPEEAVLAGCKTAGLSSGPSNFNIECQQVCVACAAQTGS